MVVLIAVLGIFACEEQKHITFKLISPEPHNTAQDSIYLSGSFNDWKPNDERYLFEYVSEGVFELDASIPNDERNIEYKYTRGSWSIAEVASLGEQMPNRELQLSKVKGVINDTIASWDKVLPAHSALPNVRVLHETFHIPELDRSRRIWIYLPTNYEESTDKRYPVIYMHDGQNLFDERFAPFGEWQVDETLKEQEESLGREVIVVGIEHGDKTRLDEYSPYKHPKHGGGEGKRYLEFIVNTLKPYIDKEYRTLPDREHTIIGGASMGGLISFCAGIYYPDTFGKLLVLSPSFWFSEQVYTDAQELLAHESFPKIYMGVGMKEVSIMPHGVEKMEELLHQRPSYQQGKKLQVFYDIEGHHNEKTWARQFPHGIEWLLSASKE